MTESLSAKRTTLLTKARGGDMDALAKLLESFRMSLKKIARIRGNLTLRKKFDTSDVVQEINIQVFGDFHMFRGKTIPEFVKWIYQILKTKKAAAIRYYDTKKRNLDREQGLYVESDNANEAIAPLVSQDGLTPVEHMIQLERACSMFEALDQLSKLQQTVVIGQFFEGLSTRELAELLEKTENAIRKTLARALANLGLKLGDMD